MAVEVPVEDCHGIPLQGGDAVSEKTGMVAALTVVCGRSDGKSDGRL